jgi:hypothetical protein
MNYQEYKIESLDGDTFFFQHSHKSALQHAKEYIERNKGKFEMTMYWRNPTPFGPTWKFMEKID